MANYSLPEIAGFLTTEKMALHGISSEVYAQNSAIVQHLGAIATTFNEGVLAVQLFGSRANGYSGLDSDIDINVIATDALTSRSAERVIIDQMRAYAPDLTTENVASVIAHIDNPVPVTPDAFTEWVMTDWGPHSIFGDGVIHSDSLVFMRLAALDVIDSHTDHDRKQRAYDRIRNNHAKVFLGDMPSVQKKLAARLGTPPHEVEAAITRPYQKRRENFGLPPRLATYRAQLAVWAAQHGSSFKDLPAYDLYRTLSATKR